MRLGKVRLLSEPRRRSSSEPHSLDAPNPNDKTPAEAKEATLGAASSRSSRVVGKAE